MRLVYVENIDVKIKKNTIPYMYDIPAFVSSQKYRWYEIVSFEKPSLHDLLSVVHGHVTAVWLQTLVYLVI